MTPSMLIAATVGATGLTVLNDLLQGKKSFQPVIAGFVVGTFLLVLAFLNTQIATAMALLLLLTSVMINGVPVLKKAFPTA